MKSSPHRGSSEGPPTHGATKTRTPHDPDPDAVAAILSLLEVDLDKATSEQERAANTALRQDVIQKPLQLCVLLNMQPLCNWRLAREPW